jgi:hypothetical protein
LNERRNEAGGKRFRRDLNIRVQKRLHSGQEANIAGDEKKFADLLTLNPTSNGSFHRLHFQLLSPTDIFAPPAAHLKQFAGYFSTLAVCSILLAGLWRFVSSVWLVISEHWRFIAEFWRKILEH